MNLITNTFDLDESILDSYIDGLLKKFILVHNEVGQLVPSSLIHISLKGLRESKCDDIIKSELGDDVIAYAVMIGGSLKLFGYEKQDLFHCTNIVSNLSGSGMIHNSQHNKFMRWIEFFFHDGLSTIK
jgi:hypothetical protein